MNTCVRPRTQKLQKLQKLQKPNYLAGALDNTQLIAFICAQMSREELYGQGRGYASVFMSMICPGVYSGTLTMMRTCPSKHKPGFNCIEFSYIQGGNAHTEYHYMAWQRCQEYHDEYKRAGISMCVKRTIEFTCDSGDHFEINT